MANGICDQFARSGKCRRGEACQYAHVSPEPPVDSDEEAERNRAQELEELLKKWRYALPGDPKAAKRAPDLSDRGLTIFFQQALELTESSEENMQLVITGLAGDGGARRIEQLLRPRFEDMDDENLKTVWSSRLLPLLKVLSHETVLMSLLIEHLHAKILSFMYGTDGKKATALLNVAVRCLADDEAHCFDGIRGCVVIIASMLSRNSSAQANSGFKAAAVTLLSLAERMPQSRRLERYLMTIRNALNLEVEPNAGQAANKTSIQATYTFSQDSPGEKSADGPRHDNDHVDIGDIQILPTMQEIQSSRLEYLPRDDPSQWHLPGIAGLIDRHFRLVREDTVGQLRDAAKFELERLNNPKRKARAEGHVGARRNVYSHVAFKEAVFDDHKGLLFVLTFEQPAHLPSSNSARQRWWEESKRLAPGALICLLSSDEQAQFLVVHSPGVQTRRDTGQPARPLHERYPLAKGYVIAQLTDTDGALVSKFLERRMSSSSPKIQHALIEFPGVMLPAFEPTLLALQQIAEHIDDLPFSEALIPDSTLSESKPPAYSTNPGFQWDLRCLVDAASDQRVTHSDGPEATLQRSTLDAAQQRAVKHALDSSIALIQGPPGTGKSYTGIKLIQSLLQNRSTANLGPIICVCYTNHALDQLLEHLVDAGVEQIIRIGGFSKSERLASVNLREVAKTCELTKYEKEQRRDTRTPKANTVKQINSILSRLNSLLDHNEGAISAFLQEENPSLYSSIFQAKDNDGFKTVGRGGKQISPFQQWIQGGTRIHRSRCRPLGVLASGQIDPKNMAHEERENLYNSWYQAIATETYEDLGIELNDHQRLSKKMDSIHGELDLRILSGANVIGITTTGLARNLNHLKKLTSKVMVVEEAGEVLEAHLLTAMLPSLEHVILIGDHQQLRPKVQNYDFQVENPRGTISLDISLFERLIRPRGDAASTGLPFVTLETQRRMHPTMSELIRSTLYPNLQDAPSVHQYPAVVGMRHRLFWFDHREKEDSLGDHMHATSHTNKHEVEMVTALVKHLVNQGVYCSSDIAVLTPYLAQLRHLRVALQDTSEIILNERDIDELGKDETGDEEDANKGNTEPEPNDRRPSAVGRGNLRQALRLATVDNFQGEEAKVVIISMVRSNDEQKCGFLATSNRINVLLSRAQHGMYIIGNSQTSARVPMWQQVLDIFKANGNIGTTMELCCPRHPETSLQITSPGQFASIAPQGGCDLLCGKQLPCGHACPTFCHAESLHNAFPCLEPCVRPRKDCEHPCNRPCKDQCERDCTVAVDNIDITLECGHRVTSLPCYQYQDNSRIKCTEEVEQSVPECGHTVAMPCGEELETIECKLPCGADLPCGHVCRKECSTCRPRDDHGVVLKIDHGECNGRCGRDYSTCEHSCRNLCHPGEECPPCDVPCTSRCIHASCAKKCSEPCTPCAHDDCSSKCPHSACQMPCAAPCDWVPCNKRCENLLGCGHQCPSLCGEACPSNQYCQTCATDDIKNVVVDYIEFSKYEGIDLDETPCIVLPCGHIFLVETLDGQMEIAKHYELDAVGTPVQVKGDLLPLSYDKPKTCPNCRGSLRTVSRYGRIVRRSLLDDSTKKFITWSNSTYIPLAHRLKGILGNLRASVDVAKLPGGTVNVSGSRLESTLKNSISGSRYKAVLKLRRDIEDFLQKVSEAEQPFQKVRDRVEVARRGANKSAKLPEFAFDKSTILQTRGELLAQALLRRCELIILNDVLSVWEHLPARERSNTKLLADLRRERKACTDLFTKAEKSMNILQQAEAHIFWAQFAALECSTPSNGTREQRDFRENLKDDAFECLDQAEQICEDYPGQTSTVAGEIANVRKMLERSISSSEMRMVVAAMSAEFSVTGHWYRCVNGHPFTIGECGGPMQTTSCPQCGAAVGGDEHIAAEGVSRADDIEEQFGDMRM